MSTLLENVATVLAAQIPPSATGGLTAGVNLFIGRIPAEAPDAVVVVHQYEGQSPLFTMGEAISALERPKIQVMVRGGIEDYPGAYTTAVAVRNALAGFQTPSASLPGVIRIEPLGTPNPTGFDQVNRPRFTLNFQIHLNAKSDGLPTP